MLKIIKGFSLIELLVVISVISLLSTVVMTSMAEARVQAYEANTLSDISQIQRALELHKYEYGNYPGYWVSGGTIFPELSTSTPNWGYLGPDSCGYSGVYPNVASILTSIPDVPNFENCYLYTGLETSTEQVGVNGYYYLLTAVYSQKLEDQIFAKNGKCLPGFTDDAVYGTGEGNDGDYSNGEWVCVSMKP